MPVTEMTRDQLRDYLVERHQQRNRVDGEIIQAYAQLTTLTSPRRPKTDLADGVAEELALDLNLSPNTIAKHLCEAQELVSRLSATVNAMVTGEVDVMRAKAMRDYTTYLDDDQASRVEQRVLDDGVRENLTQFKHALRREVIHVDPEGEEERRQLVKARRDITKWHKPDGTSTLTITLQPHEAELAYCQLDLLARHCTAPGRNRAQKRADVFMDLINGKTPDRPAVTMNVLAPMTTLMGLNQAPGEISGYGPITADYARELAKNATWRRIITDPTGQVLEVSRRRFPSPALKRHIQIRDRVCRQPGCAVPAERCETDHGIPHAHGGLSSAGNLSLLCKRHNLMRVRTRWQLQHLTPGVLVFTTPTGHSVVTRPEAYDMPPF
nr:HNH endonuclease signature motif containing protein [Kibdelosporangium sp. MJ126-NF4]